MDTAEFGKRALLIELWAFIIFNAILLQGLFQVIYAEEAPQRLSLSIADAIELADKKSPDLAVARAQLEQAQADLDKAKSALWPRLMVDGSYLLADTPSAYLFKSIDARKLPTNANFNNPGTITDIGIGSTVRWNLWSGGKDTLLAEGAGHRLKAGEEALLAVKNGLFAAVIDVYLGARMAEELLSADQASIKAVKSALEETRVKVEGGGALRSDFLSLQAREAEAEERELRTKLLKKLSLGSLRNLLSLPLSTELKLKESRFAAKDLPPQIADGMREAIANRAELRQLASLRVQAEAALEAAKRSYLPRLDLESRVSGNDGKADLQFQQPNWSAGVQVSYDIFDAGMRAAGVSSARARLVQIKEEERKVKEAIELDIERSYLALEEAETRVRVLKKALAASDESFQLVSNQYRGGSETVTRYLEAEAMFTRAKTARITAELDVERTRIQVLRALGYFAKRGGD